MLTAKQQLYSLQSLKYLLYGLLQKILQTALMEKSSMPVFSSESPRQLFYKLDSEGLDLPSQTPKGAAAKLLQSCPTLCYPIDGSPPGSSVPGILHFLLQCRKVKVKSLSRVRLLATLWTVAYQAPPSMGFSSQEYWSRVPLPSPH